MKKHVSLMGALICIIALVFSGPLYATSQPRSLNVEVAALKVHMLIEGDGCPVVVLEAGFASDSASRRSVQPQLAEFSPVVSYDRPGLGQSEPGTLPRTASQIAKDLNDALCAADLKPPYVLVAHSAGAPYSQVFAHLFPEEVDGMLPADPAPARFYGWFKRHAPKARDAMSRNAAASSLGAKQELAALDTSIKEAQEAWPMPQMARISAGSHSFAATLQGRTGSQGLDFHATKSVSPP